MFVYKVSFWEFTLVCRRYNHCVATGQPKVMKTHIDHIDPRWEEGRDYQLVCGLENSFNYCERDGSTNSSKSNRFLPWRVAQDEIGSVPVNPGDLCQFLNRETGKWVLEEFMSDWWFEQTRYLCGEHFAGIKNYLNKTGIHAPGMASKGGS